jgi:MoaA/NifB/PqqE/SkfB family radical SAM enzyme
MKTNMIKLFSVIQIETQNTCNRRCWFCKFGQERQDTEVTYLATEHIEKIAEELASLDYQGRIFPCGINEPLLDKRIIQIISLFRNTCPKAFISVNTNGDNLDESLLEDLLKAGLDALGYSIYTVAAWKKAEALAKTYSQVVMLDRLYVRIQV